MVIVKKSTTSICNVLSRWSKISVVVLSLMLLLLLVVIVSVWETTLPFIKIFVLFDSKKVNKTMNKSIVIDNHMDDIEELIQAVEQLRGDDMRLVQWDATKHTIKYQNKICPNVLPIAMTNLVQYATLVLHYAKDSNLEFADIQLLQVSLEICILCITDNPINRAIFSKGKGNDTTTTVQNDKTTTIHDVVVQLLHIESLIPYAAHLIYIATFANRFNHIGFIQANAVGMLSEIIISTSDKKSGNYIERTEQQHKPLDSIMWAAAALQNLAASYCTTPDDGRCYWEWKKKQQSDTDHRDDTTQSEKNNAPKERMPYEYTLEITSDSGTMVIDGTLVRQELVTKLPALLDQLIHWTCSGPVHQKMSKSYPYPGHNAVHDNDQQQEQQHHEFSPTIVPWATTGLLKNLLLDPEIRATVVQQYYSNVTSCLCYMSKSKDWLEANKGEGALQHLRIDSDPCWFNYQSRRRSKKERKKTKHTNLCIDRIFIDSTGSTCETYNDEETLTFDDCATPSIHQDDTTVHVLASDTCCSCGGGDYYSGPGHSV